MFAGVNEAQVMFWERGTDGKESRQVLNGKILRDSHSDHYVREY